MLDLWIKLMISLLTFSAITILTFSIFRIPLGTNHQTIAIMTLVLGFLNFYNRLIIETKLFAIITMVFFVILMMVLKRYPFFYSLLICVVGFLSASLLDAVLTVLVTKLQISSLEQISRSNWHYAIINIVFASISLLVSYYLRRNYIGFSFVIKRFYAAQHPIKSYNYLLAAVVLIAMISIQISVMNESVHVYLLYVLSASLLFVLIWAYNQNKKAMRERYNK